MTPGNGERAGTEPSEGGNGPEESDGDPAVEVESLTKEYGESITALDDVSLSIERGEFFTLLGPSGSGKSTLLGAIGGFADATAGRVRIGGEDRTDARPQDRPVSTVFQEYALFPHLTVEENVRYGLDVRGMDADRKDALVTEYLELLQIAELRGRDPDQLSGGQRQRVALARSLVVDPEVLLLDEPLGPLDEDLRQQMQFELKRLHEEFETTFVYVTHNQEEALTMSDRICLLRDGEVVELNDAETIYTTPRKAFTARFLGAGNLVEGRVASVDGDRVAVETDLDAAEIRGHTGVESLAPEDPIAVCVRPPDLRLDGEGDNTLTAAVRNRVFKGDVHEYLLELSDGTEFRATAPERIDHPPDAELTLAWDVEDCVVVTR